MWYWRDTYFRSLREVAADAAKSPAWIDYAEYCVQLETGLRRTALEVLERFIEKVSASPFEDRKDFVSWVMHQAELQPKANSLLPHPLRKRIVDPTLAEWKEREPLCSEPRRWLGSYDELKEALSLDPTDEIARRKFVKGIINRVGMSAHELPRGYLGDDPQADLARLSEAEAEASRLSNEEERRRATERIGELKADVHGHLRLTMQGSRR